MPKKSTPEGAILRSILDYFAATGVMAFRMQTGMAVYGSRRVPFGVPGMADILAFPANRPPLWVEAKAANGVQSELQRSFQSMVLRQSHDYVLARSLDDVIEAMAQVEE